MIFTTRYRPAEGARGFYRATVRHGVSRVLSHAPHETGGRTLREPCRAADQLRRNE